MPTHHRTAIVEGHEIAYREAGSPDAPVLLLLHGFPTSSFMFRHLIPLLEDRYHLIAPDHIGFGRSATPSVDAFDYSFDGLARITEGLLDRLGVKDHAMFVQDYGAPGRTPRSTPAWAGSAPGSRTWRSRWPAARPGCRSRYKPSQRSWRVASTNLPACRRQSSHDPV